MKCTALINSSSIFTVVVASRVQTDFQCSPSFPHLDLVRCVYCDKLLVEKIGKHIYVEVTE